MEILSRQTFYHTKIFDPLFLLKTGLKQDMQLAFNHAGWYKFAELREPGSKILTMEFLMSLSSEETGRTTNFYFRLFDEQYQLSTTEFSEALGFDKKCITDPKVLIKKFKYDRTTWWNEISEDPWSSKNSIVSIHTPTLRMLAKWICMVVHPRSNLRLCSLPELQCLFTMVWKIKFSPILSMATDWQKMIPGKSPIDITSLVTRIATYVNAKALNNA